MQNIDAMCNVKSKNKPIELKQKLSIPAPPKLQTQNPSSVILDMQKALKYHTAIPCPSHHHHH